MKKIKASQSDQEFLKVAKLNQKESDSLMLFLKEENAKWKSEIDSTERFIAEIEANTGIKAPEPQLSYHEMSIPSIEEQDWNSLVKEAEFRFPQFLGYEDLLSPEEIAEVNRNFDAINDEFSKKTKLNKLDWSFLAIATALQCVRQYVIDPWLKNKRPSSSKNDEKGHKNNGDPGWYYVAKDKIWSNRVPFDAQIYNPANPSVAKFLAGAKDHRNVTLGHDPLLGWVFGTANIMTSTITRYDMKTAHVKYQPKQIIHSLADNAKMTESCINRVTNEGKDGKIALGLAVAREALHLGSDIYTKDSLPIPIISTFSPKAAETLASYGIDTASVGTEATLAMLINWLISMVHGLFYDESIESRTMYEVRTRKILLYSNLLASSSNLIVTAITKDASKLDVGGLLVTIGRLFSDIKFITKVKQDFIDSKIEIQYQGLEREICDLYNQKLIVSF